LLAEEVMLAEEDKNAEEKSPLDGRWLLLALLARPRLWGRGAAARVCACMCCMMPLLCRVPACRRRALVGQQHVRSAGCS